MSEPRRPSRLIQAWEGAAIWVQITIALPALSLALFLVNLGPFRQPLWRSVLYGLLEGGLVTALLLAVTAGERSRR